VDDILTKADPKPTERIGSSGTVIQGGYIVDNEKSSDLKGAKKYVTFSEMLANVSIVSAGVRYFLNLIANSGWTVVPANDTPEAQELADFVEEAMYDLETPWVRVVRRAAMYRFYGFSIQEWTAKKRMDGRIGMLDIEPRPQATIEKWDRDENGRIVNVVQRSPQTQREIELPRSKLVYIVDDSLNDSPEGLGLFRHVVPHAKRLLRYEQLEGFGFETDLRGIPVARVPKALLNELVNQGKISKAQMDEAIRVMEVFIQNHIKSPEIGLILDSLTYQTQDEKGNPSTVKQWDLELLKGESSALEDLGQAINRLTQSIARILGVEHLLLGADSRGSHALAKDKTASFFLIINSTLEELTYAFEKDFIDPLWHLNGFNEDLKPGLETEAIKFRDVSEIAGALRDLATAGAPIDPSDPVINDIRALLGVSTLENLGIMDSLILEDPEQEPNPDTLPDEGDGDGA
jgi:hypothetical protein